MIERTCTLPQMPAGASRLNAADRFSFRCGADLECFTKCCADVNIVLTPYDVLRLKQALRMDSAEFLQSFTVAPFTKEQKFPILFLKMDAGRRCPLLNSSGCSVYGSRPWACRMYPLGVAAPDSPAERPFYFVIRENFCAGHGAFASSATAAEWMRDQGVEQYEMMGAPFRDLTLHPFWNSGRDLTPEQTDMFYMACYDLDRFRRFVFETRFLTLFEIDEARIETLATDDEELLDFAIQWLRFSLFGERTMKLRRGAAPRRRAARPGGGGPMTPILVIGGGIAGITAAIEAAESGCDVVLVEQAPWLGGRVAAMRHYFPKLCPPACGLEIEFRRIRNNPRITVLAGARVESLANSEACVRIEPRHVTSACTMCGDCAAACPARAVHAPPNVAFPALYSIDRAACPEGCAKCAEACRYDAIDLGQQPEWRTFKIASTVVATGWAPYDAARLEAFGFGRYPNVVTNVMLDHMAAAGPILRPGDGRPPNSVVFVQCAGSRDENHLPYCSGVCCSASLKHATYIRTQNPDADVTLFYIDVRTPGRLENFYAKARDGIRLVKGKVARVEQNDATGDLLVTAEDVLAGVKKSHHAELVVLAVGMTPQTRGLPDGLAGDGYGFLREISAERVFAAGCVRRPTDVSGAVRDAMGAALKAMQCARAANG